MHNSGFGIGSNSGMIPHLLRIGIGIKHLKELLESESEFGTLLESESQLESSFLCSLELESESESKSKISGIAHH